MLAGLASWQAVIRRLVCRRCRRRDWDEVAADAITGLWQHVNAGRPVRSVSGLALAFVRTAVSRMRRQPSGLSFCEMDQFADRPRTRGTETTPLSERSWSFAVGNLRGSRERWLCQRALEGWSAVEMAKSLGRPLAKVRHQLLTLAAKVTDRRRGERV
jgi:DNA-directed RNA polymerase specialized sigma24 family protein